MIAALSGLTLSETAHKLSEMAESGQVKHDIAFKAHANAAEMYAKRDKKLFLEHVRMAEHHAKKCGKLEELKHWKNKKVK